MEHSVQFSRSVVSDSLRPHELQHAAMAPHSSTLAWKIPWTEEPGRLQSVGSLRVGNDWMTSLSLFTFMLWRRKWQPTPVFLPGESQGRGSLVGCRLWGRTEADMTEATQQQQQQQQQLIIVTNLNWEPVSQDSYPWSHSNSVSCPERLPRTSSPSIILCPNYLRMYALGKGLVELLTTLKYSFYLFSAASWEVYKALIKLVGLGTRSTPFWCHIHFK